MSTGRARAVIGMVAVLLASSLAAQQPSSEPASGCYRFAFGPWTPALDWARAGHDSATERYRGPARPTGSMHRGAMPDAPRESAVRDSTSAGETLLLFPSWWPAGVSVRFPAGAAGEPVRGEARALVADGRAEPPTSDVTVWRVPCGG